MPSIQTNASTAESYLGDCLRDWVASGSVSPDCGGFEAICFSDESVDTIAAEMPYAAKAIANFFIDSAIRAGKSFTPMKLQKLVYFAHGWSLAIYGQPLIDEQIEAWTFGPVVRSLYASLAGYGNSPVTKPISERDYLAEVDQTPRIADSDTPITALLKAILESYGGYTAAQLSNMTHAPDSPWKRVYDAHAGDLPRGTDIPQDWIRDYFCEQARAQFQGQAT